MQSATTGRRAINKNHVAKKSDKAHIDHKVRVPIYILIFAIYLSQSQWVGEKNRMNLNTDRIRKGRVEVLVRLVVS